MNKVTPRAVPFQTTAQRQAALYRQRFECCLAHLREARLLPADDPNGEYLVRRESALGTVKHGVTSGSIIQAAARVLASEYGAFADRPHLHIHILLRTDLLAMAVGPLRWTVVIAAASSGQLLEDVQLDRLVI